MSPRKLLVNFIIKFEIILLILCLTISLLELRHRIHLKASLLADSVRNDFILDDKKAIHQKFQIAIISHEFSSIELSDDKNLSNDKISFPIIKNIIPILAIPEKREGQAIGNFMYTYSIVPGLTRGLTLWVSISIFILLLFPFISVNMEKFFSRELEIQKNRELNFIVLSIAHDIRSPLSALNSLIFGVSEIPPDAKDIISQVSERINSIANDLIAKTKHESSLNMVAPHRNLSSDLLGLLHKISKEKAFEFNHIASFEIQIRTDRLDPSVCLLIPDKELLRVLSNLINNSVEAIRENGKIIIQAFSDREIVRIDLFDFGVGIPDEVLVQLLNKRLSTKEGGTGIGLFSAYQVLKKYGADIKISSKENVGTHVSISFPLQ